jgi:acetolactate synthase-1/3 small subunit
MKETYNISIFTENSVGMLNRITIIFTRRHINIDSITASESEVEGVHRYTIVAKMSEVQVKKLVGQIEKQVEVLKAFYHTDEEVIYQELALFKIPTEIFIQEGGIERIIRAHHIRVLTIEKDFVALEKTARPEEITMLYRELFPYGILEFVRSGRIIITKPMKKLEEFINNNRN